VETEAAGESMQSTEPIKTRSFFSRLAGTYASPRETFQDVGRWPGVLWPMIALMILGMITTYCTSLKVNLQSMAVEQIVDQQVAQGNMTQQQADQLRERVSSPSIASAIASVVFAGLGSILVVLIAAAVAKLVCSAVLGVENQFKSVFSVSLYVWLAVGIVHAVLFLVILYFKNPADLSVSNINSVVASNLEAMLTGIMGEDVLPKYLAKLLGWVDIFAIWKIALLAIGYSAVSRKLKTGKAAAWIVAVYVVLALIGSANPKKDMIDAINHFFPDKASVPSIHQSSFIDKSCRLGKNLRIGPNVVIEEDVVIGDGCSIEANTVIKKGTIIGKNVRIKSCSVIGGNGFGYDKGEDESAYQFLPHFGRVIIEDEVDIGSNTCIDKGSLSDTIIRKGVKIDNLVHIAHNVDIGENTLVIACSMVAGSVVIGENSWIAPAASIRNGLKIGKNCTVGLGSVLTNDIGDNSTVLGVPAVDIEDFKYLRKLQKEMLKSKK